MLKHILATAIALTATTAIANAEPILGKWRAPGGAIVEVEPCGDAYCATVITGRHKGKDAGSMRGEGGVYSGTVTDPRDDRSYSGRAKVEGDALEMTGCALKVLCKTQTWTRS